jgi:hypothetical protein
MQAAALRDENRATRAESPATDAGSTLMATSRWSLISRAVDLAHSARAKRRKDFILTEAIAWN